MGVARASVKQVLVVDDHAVMRAATIAALRHAVETGTATALTVDTVFFEASTADEATRMLQDRDIDLAVVDVQLGDERSGLDVIADADVNTTTFVVLTSSLNPRVIVDAEALGVAAVIPKAGDAADLVQAVDSAGKGLRLLTGADAKRARQELADLGAVRWEDLSDRERLVANMVADGATEGDIADRLFISGATVRNLLSAIYKKAGVEDRKGLLEAVWVERKLDRA